MIDRKLKIEDLERDVTRDELAKIRGGDAGLPPTSPMSGQPIPYGGPGPADGPGYEYHPGYGFPTLPETGGWSYGYLWKLLGGGTDPRLVV